MSTQNTIILTSIVWLIILWSLSIFQAVKLNNVRAQLLDMGSINIMLLADISRATKRIAELERGE